jgi:hypothetical protein
LPVILTHDEVESRGRELALAVQCAVESEEGLALWLEQMKRAKKSMVADVDSRKAEAIRLADVVASGKEKRDVSCTWKYAIPAGWAFLVRNDTGERILSRKLKDEERQLTLGEPPYAEPTPDELAEWLKALPVNEEQTLSEGHAGDVEADDRAVDLWPPAEELMAPPDDDADDDGEEHDPLLDPGGFASEGQDEDGNTLGGDDDWDDDPALDTEEEILEEQIDAIVTDYNGEPLDAAGATAPPLNPNPGISELAAMPDEQVAKLARRK